MLNSSEGEGEENAADDKPTESGQKRATTWKRPLGLVKKKVTENEQTEPTLHDKVSSLVDSLLASGLNEPTFLKRKENIKKPKNCKLLRVTKVNSEIWDIAQKTTRSMDARLQKVQESVVKGIIPIARLMGTTGEVREKKGTMPSPDEL